MAVIIAGTLGSLLGQLPLYYLGPVSYVVLGLLVVLASVWFVRRKRVRRGS